MPKIEENDPCILAGRSIVGFRAIPAYEELGFYTLTTIRKHFDDSIVVVSPDKTWIVVLGRTRGDTLAKFTAVGRKWAGRLGAEARP